MHITKNVKEDWWLIRPLKNLPVPSPQNELGHIYFSMKKAMVILYNSVYHNSGVKISL